MVKLWPICRVDGLQSANRYLLGPIGPQIMWEMADLADGQLYILFCSCLINEFDQNDSMQVDLAVWYNKHGDYPGCTVYVLTVYMNIMSITVYTYSMCVHAYLSLDVL